MSGVTAEELMVVGALRAAFEQGGGPGSAVNSHPNPFFISLGGSFDLLAAGKRAIVSVDQHRASVARLAALETAKTKPKADEPNATVT